MAKGPTNLDYLNNIFKKTFRSTNVEIFNFFFQRTNRASSIDLKKKNIFKKLWTTNVDFYRIFRTTMDFINDFYIRIFYKGFSGLKPFIFKGLSGLQT